MVTNTVAKACMQKPEFVSYIARLGGVPVAEANRAYALVINGIKQAMEERYLLKLHGFGEFYPQLHRAHSMQFMKDAKPMGDYLVVKFSAALSLNRRLRSGRPLVSARTRGGSGGK